jgi:phosphoglycerate kinase
MKSIRELNLRHKTVFLRVDFNVPLNDNQEITEDARIKAALNTIQYLIQEKAKVVIGSHLGRPKGQVKNEFRMLPVAKRLGDYLGQDVHYVDDCIGPEVDAAKERLEPGDVLLLENLRFHPGEESNDLHFAEQLEHGIDVYITDAFGVIHRKHASTYALPSLIFDKGIGFLIEEEIDALDKIVGTPKKPFVVVVGGIKISDKVDVIRKLAPMSDAVLVAGGVANTFMKGLGHDIGGSIVESDSVSKEQESINYVDVAMDIWRRFETEHATIEGVTAPDGGQLQKIIHPIDFVAAPSPDDKDQARVIELGEDVPEGWMFLDIGPKSQALFAEVIGTAHTVFWNGPIGVFEVPEFAEGSRVVAQAAADIDGYSVLGGGDTESVVQTFDLGGHFGHVSTGGGASLTYLAQKPTPGLEALD